MNQFPRLASDMCRPPANWLATPSRRATDRTVLDEDAGIIVSHSHSRFDRVSKQGLWARWRCRLCRTLCVGAMLSMFMMVGTTQAQVDDVSHRRLGGPTSQAGDSRAQGELLTRLRRLTDPARIPNGLRVDPPLRPDLRRMLSQQVQDALRSLPPSQQQPLEDLIRQHLESRPGGPNPSPPGRQSNPKRPSGAPSRPLTLEDLDRLLSDTDGTPDAPSTAPPERSPNENPNPSESAADRDARIADLAEMLRRFTNRGKSPPGLPDTGNGGSSPPVGRTGTSQDPNSVNGLRFNQPRVRDSTGGPTSNEPTRSEPTPSEPTPSDPRPSSSTPRDSAPPDSISGGTDQSGNPTRVDRVKPKDPPREKARSDPEPDRSASEADVWTKLDRIMHVARNRGNRATSDADNGARSALAQAIEATASDLAARVENIIEEQSQPVFEEPPAGPGFLERVGRATESANEWASELASPDSPTTGTVTTQSQGNIRGFSVMSLLVGGLILIVCVLLFRFRDVFNSHSREAALPTAPQNLRNRADVVQAFHALAARFPEILNDWWPHRRAAVAIARVNPDQRAAIHTLARMYEVARYAPQDLEFSEQQLTAARHALRRFGVS